jgi:hypothetical protein
LLGLIGEVSRRQKQCPVPELTRSVGVNLNARVSFGPCTQIDALQ